MARILVGRILDSGTDSVTAEQGTPPWLVAEQNQLVPEAYDYIELGYTGSLLTTATYKTGGAAGTIVAVLTLTYNASNCIETVTRT